MPPKVHGLESDDEIENSLAIYYSSKSYIIVIIIMIIIIIMKENRKGLINHLLFMDALKLYGKNKKQVDTLVNTVRIFSKDIGVEFGISKCAVLIMKWGKA